MLSLSPEPTPTVAPSPTETSEVPLKDANNRTDDGNDNENETDDPATQKTKTEAVAAEAYDGPVKTGKTLRDLLTDLGAPDSLSGTVDDMQEALFGITSDLVGSNGGVGSDRLSLSDILTRGNRLRGLGAVLVLASVIALLVDFLAGDSLGPVGGS
jgi:hypothetical protein